MEKSRSNKRLTVATDAELLKKLTEEAKAMGLSPTQMTEFIFKGVEQQLGQKVQFDYPKGAPTSQPHVASKPEPISRSTSNPNVAKLASDSQTLHGLDITGVKKPEAERVVDPRSATMRPSKSGKRDSNAEDIMNQIKKQTEVKDEKKEKKKVLVDDDELVKRRPSIGEDSRSKKDPSRRRSLSSQQSSAQEQLKKSAIDKERTKYNEKRRYEALESNDTARLESVYKTDKVEDPKQVFQPKEDFSYENYRFVQQVAKTSGVVAPEIVILGKHGCGKSSLLEALVGRPINYVAFQPEGATKRPLHFHLTSTSENENPNFLIQATAEKKKAAVDVTTVPIELKKLNSDVNQFNEESIIVTQEFKYCFNMTVIDNPGLPFDSESEEYTQVEQYLQEFLRPAHRLILCVEEADQEHWDDVDKMRQLVKTFDPYGKRTLWISNKFRTLLDTFTSSSQLNDYLHAQTNTTPPKNIYWVTLPSQKERESAPAPKAFLQLQEQIDERDRRALQMLNCSTKYYQHMGVKQLRKAVLDWCWKSYYHREVPKLFKALEIRKQKNADQMNKVQILKETLNLRLLASRFASRYVQAAQSILQGTSKANPSINGETRKEELDDQYFVSPEWDVPSGSIPFESTRLYGGQQFERVFSEFRAILSKLQVDERDADLLPDPDDKKYLWTACELVGKQIENLLMPLIEQLITRSTFVMSRIPTVADNLMGNSQKENKLVIDASYYKNLSNYLRDLFMNAVEKLSDQCKSLCMEEFYAPKTIHWDITELQLTKEDLSDREGLLHLIFDRLRNRTGKNCIRKVYNLFLLPFMKANIWNDIQTHIAVMPEQQLDEIFDLQTINESLDEDISSLEKTQEDIIAQEQKLHEVAPKLAF